MHPNLSGRRQHISNPAENTGLSGKLRDIAKKQVACIVQAKFLSRTQRDCRL